MSALTDGQGISLCLVIIGFVCAAYSWAFRGEQLK